MNANPILTDPTLRDGGCDGQRTRSLQSACKIVGVVSRYGMATTSRLRKIVDLFFKRAL